jgi:hypothetical protein
MATINLSLTSKITDEAPASMSEVIAIWLVGADAASPPAILRSTRWNGLLLLAANSGRALEQERAAIVMEWVWAMLKSLQPLAVQGGFGTQWLSMTTNRTEKSAWAASMAASDKGLAWDYFAMFAAWAAGWTIKASGATRSAEDDAVSLAAYKKFAAKEEAMEPTDGTIPVKGIDPAFWAAWSADWDALDPYRLLERLLEVQGASRGDVIVVQW